jgi:hypothetical protein
MRKPTTRKTPTTPGSWVLVEDSCNPIPDEPSPPELFAGWWRYVLKGEPEKAEEVRGKLRDLGVSVVYSPFSHQQGGAQ